MRACFADTFYFLALLNPDDRAHASALHYAERLPGRLITTAWVVTELADALCEPFHRPAFLELFESLRDEPAVEIIPPDVELFDRGMDLYSHRLDKAWSLTDCISFVVMTERGLVEALTGDHHFE